MSAFPAVSHESAQNSRQCHSLRLPLEILAEIRKDGAESVQEDLQSDAITASVHDHLEQRVNRTKDDVMKLFGYGKGRLITRKRARCTRLRGRPRFSSAGSGTESVLAMSGCVCWVLVSAVCVCINVFSPRSRKPRSLNGQLVSNCNQLQNGVQYKLMVATANFKLAPGTIATARAVLDALD